MDRQPPILFGIDSPPTKLHRPCSDGGWTVRIRIRWANTPHDIPTSIRFWRKRDALDWIQSARIGEPLSP